MAFAETVYSIWKYRNDECFGNNVDNTMIGEKIIDILVYEGCRTTKLKSHITKVMM